ncbi:MAG: MFS transporter [Alphaproteobacteria bacterium]|nr:MFS transporter [Alphaproteobacteria bacterium]
MIQLHSRRSRIGFLGALYLVQGLPYGFQAKALPIYLREQGISLETIGYLSLLALPWMLKALWAPLVDRFYLPAVGRRRSWVLPMQAGMAACAAAGAFARMPEDMHLLAGLILLMNVFAATQDVAVDGWAVELLGQDELGPANAAQVVGYKLGMLLSGGLLVTATASIGWSGLFAVMAGLTLAVLVLVGITEESPPAAESPPPDSLADILRALKLALARPGVGWVMAFIVSYKLGETLIDAMFKPFLVDQGFTAPQIGLWVGTWGTVASLLGSLAGGALAARLPLLRAVGIAATLRVLPELGQLGLAVAAGAGGPLAEVGVIAVTCGEHFFGGLLTTAMFAWMMSQVDRRIGGTHYTVLASVEVLGKLGAGFVSGRIAASLGYVGVFGLGVGLGVAYLALLWPLSRAPRPQTSR